MRRLFPVALLLIAVVLSGCLSFRQGYGSIYVTSSPNQGSIWLDGQDTNEKTPALLTNVWAGKHTVEVRFPGMDPASADVFVRRSEQSTVALKLHPKGSSPGDAGKGSVYGFVLESRAGSPVAGATVRAYVSGTSLETAEATTDDDGAFGFSLPPGTYDIVATKPGHAAAKRQALSVDAGGTEIVDLISRKLFDLTKSAVAPTLSVSYDDGGAVVPFDPGVIVAGYTPVYIDVDADDVARISVRIGHRNMTPDIEWWYEPSAAFNLGSVSGGVPLAPLGATELIVDAYDFQGNWVETAIPFVRTGGSPSTAPPPVTGLDLTAVTYGDDMELFSIDEVSTLGLKQDTSVYVIVRWGAVPDAQAYELERAWSPAGPWRRIARLGALLYDGSQTPYRDTSADLVPGIEVFYRMRAIGHDGTPGDWSGTVSVTPLGRFQVRLVEPKDGATGVSLNPVFRWEYDDVGADAYTFQGVVLGVTLDPYESDTWVFQAVNITEAPFNFDGSASRPLKPAKSYRWGIYSAEARSEYGSNSRAIALSGRDVGAVNGDFIFTTGYGF